MNLNTRQKFYTCVAPGALSAFVFWLSLAVVASELPSAKAETPVTKTGINERYPALPEAITSFGAAISDGWLYVYGGNTGKTHEYSRELQSNHFRRLNLTQAGSLWEELPGEERLQGLAMVAHGGKIYRIGGFTAKNATGEKKDLWSMADVARFDPTTKTWEKLPSLPTPRSSHDAVVSDNKIYVAGGWAMHGRDGKSEWHRKALVLDLTQANLAWQELPEPPFQRRALSLATLNGKIYAIGGMHETGSTTTDVDYYDPIEKAWHSAPDLPGKPIEGFGNSSFEVGGKLLVSTVEGNVQQLDGDKWILVSHLQKPRFFHRMLPLSADELIFLGGASRSGERATQLETIRLETKAP